MISWAVLMIVVVCLWFLGLSHFGTLTLAIKNNEELVRFLGYETLLPRAIIIAFSAFIAAIGGALFALYNGFVTPMALHWSLSGEALVIAIIGGTRAARSEEHTSELQSLMRISYAVFCLKKKNKIHQQIHIIYPIT